MVFMIFPPEHYQRQEELDAWWNGLSNDVKRHLRSLQQALEDNEKHKAWDEGYAAQHPKPAEGNCWYWYHKTSYSEEHFCDMPPEHHYELRNSLGPPPQGGEWSSDREYYPDHKFKATNEKEPPNYGTSITTHN